MVGLRASFQDVEAGLETAGVTVVAGAKSSVAQRNGVAIFTYSFEPAYAQWADPELEAFLRTVLEYGEMAHALQQNRGPSTFGLRASLRERLDLAPLLDRARAARVVVRENKHLTVKDYFFRHPAFGEFVQVNVLRGQSHVVDVTFSAPQEYLAITHSLSVTDVCRQAAATKPRATKPRATKPRATTSRAVSEQQSPDRAPDLMDQFADRPLPKTPEEADALMADVFSAALGRRVERRPDEPSGNHPLAAAAHGERRRHGRRVRFDRSSTRGSDRRRRDPRAAR